MSAFTVECSSCKKKFKTLYSLNKHARERHKALIEDSVVPVFKDHTGNQVLLRRPEKLNKEDHAGYTMWLAGMVERINATFHPRLPGKINGLNLRR